MDGFKSYTTKVTVENLDKNFTAITGVNGSGKSNIIDGILFALDLGTTGKMRATSLKELINTQRTECKVTVTFSNKNKAKSPPGYEIMDEIEISRVLDSEGKSKYKVNGHSCTKATIEAFCRVTGITSNFVILQGHITKLLNMKKTELKEMIEEVAGTKSYNKEKIKASEAMEKKEIQLKEVKEYLNKSISPFINKLTEERMGYVAECKMAVGGEKVKEELKEAERVKKEGEWGRRVEELERVWYEWMDVSEQLAEVEGRLKGIGAAGCEEELMSLKGKIGELEEQREESNPGEVEVRLAEAQREMAGIGEVEDLGERRARLVEREQILEREIFGGNKVEELERVRRAIARKEAEVSAGCGLEKLIGRNFGAKIQEGVERLRRCTGEAEEVGRLEGWRLGERILRHNEAVRNLRGKLEEEARTIRMKLPYDPQPGIYGTVDENFELVDQKYAVAVSVIFGAKSKFVICETDEIAASVLTNSEKRVSCIPLNKIIVRETPVPESRGINALRAVTFNSSCEKAFRFLMQNFFIFEKAREAEKFCFEKKVPCITLDGVVYDPRGTLTGGRPTPPGEVVRSAELKEINRILKEIQVLGDDAEIRRWTEEARRQEVLGKELAELREKAELLERMCGGADLQGELNLVRGELSRLRVKEVVEAAKRKRRDQLEREIADLAGNLRGRQERCAVLDSELAAGRRALREAEQRNGTRRGSLREAEELERRRRQLVKETVGAVARMEKLWESVSEKENRAGRFRPEAVDRHLFQVPRRVLTREEEDELDRRIAECRAVLGAQGRRCTVDPKKFELLDKHLEMVRGLEGKIRTLESDRGKILASIERLSALGAEENARAFSCINGNLARFFRYFVPGAEIFIDEAFEIRLRMGEWATTLTELSGGQRSLVALSLIFSMLMYRPAPLYIFDEVDAALDLNYTQSIGEIIRREFKEAQFLVVSLKSNLYDNANRIFRVQVQDGRTDVLQIK